MINKKCQFSMCPPLYYQQPYQVAETDSTAALACFCHSPLVGSWGCGKHPPCQLRMLLCQPEIDHVVILWGILHACHLEITEGRKRGVADSDLSINLTDVGSLLQNSPLHLLNSFPIHSEMSLFWNDPLWTWTTTVRFKKSILTGWKPQPSTATLDAS